MRDGVRLPLMPLTATAFAPFGAVLAHDPECGRSVNGGHGWRTDLPGLDDRDLEAAPSLALYRLKPQALPLVVGLFERHPGSPQCFAALTVARFVVVVAPPGVDGLPDPARACAFMGTRGMGLRYARGQWHAPMAALDTEGDMLMLAFERHARSDCVEHRLADPFLVISDSV